MFNFSGGFMNAGFIPGQDAYGKDPKIWGTKPIIPPAPDYQAALNKIIAGDTAELPELGKLASGATDLYKSLLEKAAPGIGDMMKQGGLDIAGMLKGEVPGLDEYISRTAAESSSAYGDLSLSKPRMGFEAKRSLMAEGLAAMPRYTAMAKDMTFDFSKLIAGQDMAVKQADATFERDYAAAIIAAAPDPAARGDRDASMMALGMMLHMWGGGAYTGGQYQPKYGNSPIGDNGGGGQSDWGGGSQSYFSNSEQGGWGSESNMQGGSGGTGSGQGFDAIDTSSIMGMA